MSGDITDLTKAARALEHYGEDEHAENVRAYVRRQIGRWPRFYAVYRSIVYWAVMIGGAAIAFGGAIEYALSGRYYAAFGLLAIMIAIYGLLAATSSLAEKIASWAEEDVGALEVRA